jgi:O-antigen/teichoic acid export membrane protein
VGTELVIRILSLAVMIGLFGESVIPLLKGVGQPQRVTIMTAVLYITLVLLIWDFSNRFGVVGAALAWLPAVLISQVISAYFAREILYRPFRILIAPMTAVLIAAVFSAVFAFGIVQVFSGIVGLVSAVLAGLSLYAGILWYSDRHFGLGFSEDFSEVFPKIAARLGLGLSSAGN